VPATEIPVAAASQVRAARSPFGGRRQRTTRCRQQPCAGAASTAQPRSRI